MPADDPNPPPTPRPTPVPTSGATASANFFQPADHRPNADPRHTPGPKHTHAEKPGDHIGPYKLLELLGEGGFGCVWAAEQTHPLKRRVALKLLNPGMDTKTVLARFEQERQALAMMDHPNIARVLDAGVTAAGESAPGRPYFVMELVRGVPITQFCDSAQLTPRQRMELMQQVARAVQHAHLKGIIHRDIKPSNVLVTLHGDQPVPKVIDFGIAKATTQPLTDKTIYTEFRQLIGTPPYMSPEQAEMSGLDIDTRTDIYGLGALAYELLTGSPPLDPDELRRAGIAEVYRLIKESEPPKPSTKVTLVAVALGGSRSSGVGGKPSSADEAEGHTRAIAARRGCEPGKLAALLKGEVDWIVMKAMEKDRTRRYETAEAMAADIGRYLSGEAVLAGPPSAGYRVRRFVRRNKAAVMTVCAVCITLIAGIAATGWQWAEARKANTLLISQNKGVIESLTELVRTLQLVEPDNSLGHYTLGDGRKVTIVRRTGTDWKVDVRILPGHVPSPEAALDQAQPEIDPSFAMQTLAMIVEDNAMKMHEQALGARAGADAAAFGLCATFDESTGQLMISQPLTPAALRHINRLKGVVSAHIMLQQQSIVDTLQLLAHPDTGLKSLNFLELYFTSRTDEGLKVIARSGSGLKTLTGLSLMETDVTDEGLISISRSDTGLSALTLLGIAANSKVTDEGVMALTRSDSGLKVLAKLTLINTGVTEKGVAAIKASRPEIKIEQHR